MDNKNINQLNYDEGPKSKMCRKCKVEKSLDEFHNDKRNADGKSSMCKKCRHEYDKKQKHYYEFKGNEKRLLERLKKIRKEIDKFIEETNQGD